MTTKEKKAFREKHSMSAMELSTIAKILILLASAHEKMLEACIQLYNWVEEKKGRKDIVVELICITHKYTVKEATGLVEQYLAWGNGSINKEFFALPLAERERVKKFSIHNINYLLANKNIIVINRNQDNGTFYKREVYFGDLTPEQFKTVFTYRGRIRSEDEQETTLKTAEEKLFNAPIDGCVHTKAGTFSFVYYLKKAMQIVNNENDIRTNKKHVAKLTTVLKQAQARGKIIEENQKK